jgi:hypothetical protein
MKNLTVVIIALAVCVTSFAQEKVLKEMKAEKINKSAAPEAVVVQAQKDFPKATPVQYYSVGETSKSEDWKISEEVNFDQGDKVQHYGVHLQGEGGEYQALYDDNGKLVMSKQYEKDTALPKPIAETLSKDFPGAKAKSDGHVKVIHHSGVKKEYYDVVLEDGKHLIFTETGRL